MTNKFIVFITGASGVGKTTLLNNLQAKYSHKSTWEFLKFDSIGIPSTEQVIKDYGSVENWQRQKTFEWIEKMIHNFPDKELVIMDGQANLEFIKTGFEQQNFTDYQIVLIDCTQDIMIKRLIDERQQAWLASEDMNNWLKFLRNQAQQLQQPIIDTSEIEPNKVVEQFEQTLLGNHIKI